MHISGVYLSGCNLEMNTLNQLRLEHFIRVVLRKLSKRGPILVDP